MRAMKFEDSPEGPGGLRGGTLANRLLMTGREGRPENYTLGFTNVVGGYNVPRHRHNFDQVRYITHGKTNFAEKMLYTGWVGYFPEGCYYGPQARPDSSGGLTFQFGGPTGYGYLSRAQQKKARLELERNGAFEKGYYTYLDDQGKRHNKDAFEAIYEHHVGEKVVYPPSRYSDIVIINPENFAWMPDSNESGVAYKWVGAFGERGTRLGFIRVAKGAAVSCGTHDRAEVIAIVKGAVSAGGKEYSRHSAFGFDASEGPTSLTAVEATEFICLQLPKF